MRVEGAASHTLVSDYADTDLEEGFAEAFAYYVQRPDTLKTHDSDSFGFFEGLGDAPCSLTSCAGLPE